MLYITEITDANDINQNPLFFPLPLWIRSHYRVGIMRLFLGIAVI